MQELAYRNNCMAFVTCISFCVRINTLYCLCLPPGGVILRHNVCMFIQAENTKQNIIQSLFKILCKFTEYFSQYDKIPIAW